MPNVPRLPGVPPLLSYVPNAVILLTVDALTLLGGLFTPPWGLFRNGAPVVVADNVLSFDLKRDWTLPTYPMAPNAFQTYDRVQLPFDVKLRFSTGGTEIERQDFLDSIEAVSNTLDLFDAVVPERVYPSVSVRGYDYRRTAESGLGLLVVDLMLVQVRVTAQATFSNTKQPSAANPVSGGQVQPAPLTGDFPASSQSFA